MRSGLFQQRVDHGKHKFTYRKHFYLVAYCLIYPLTGFLLTLFAGSVPGPEACLFAPPSAKRYRPAG